MSQYLKIALIPAYNLEECLIQVVQQLREKGFWILIVDDGSDIEHKPIFQEVDDAGNVLILTHEKNKGKGSALKTGMAYIQTHVSENYAIVTADADGQHRAKVKKKQMQEKPLYSIFC